MTPAIVSAALQSALPGPGPPDRCCWSNETQLPVSAAAASPAAVSDADAAGSAAAAVAVAAAESVTAGAEAVRLVMLAKEDKKVNNYQEIKKKSPIYKLMFVVVCTQISLSLTSCVYKHFTY